MTPGMDLPIIPIFINCTVPSLPPTRRCYALGRSIAGALRAVTEFERIAVIASGSLSLEIGGPRAFTDQTFGVPDPEWASWILDRVRHCEHDRLIEAATEERMLAAGNVAGELLNWIIALGITGRRTPDLLLDQPGARKPSG
jgi:protocatechuate 4,5-dioxygenase beta chain